MTAVATFDLVPEFEHVTTKRRRAKQTSRDQGFVQRRQLWEVEIKSYRLTWRVANDAMLARIRELWALTFGPVLTLTYTPPGGSATEVAFADDTLATIMSSRAKMQFTVELEEVR